MLQGSSKRVVPRALSDLAADAVKLVRQVQPRGPYILLGSCVVGAVAMEVAQQLTDAGEHVPLVILSDVWAPGFREGMTKWDKLLRQLQHRSYNMKLDLAAVRRGEISKKEAIERTGIFNLLRGRSLAGDRSMRQLEVMTEGFHSGWYLTQIMWACTHHRPEPYPGRVVQFRSSFIPEGRLFERNFGWSGIIKGEYEVFDTPGHHDETWKNPAALSVISDRLSPILRAIDEQCGMADSRGKKRV